MCLGGLCYFERHHFYENRGKKGQGAKIERQVELNENENLTANLHHTYLKYRIIYHIPHFQTYKKTQTFYFVLLQKNKSL